MKRLALFVGINTYKKKRLNCARADAEVLHAEFSRHYDVTKLLVDKNATPEMIISELDDLQKQAKAGDMLVFFFSGHGSDFKGERLLAVPDYDKHGTFTETVGLSTATLRKKTDVRGLHRLFILDCCRTHYDEESEILDEASDSGKGTGYVRRHGKRAIVWPTMLSSSSPGQTSYEHSAAGHGYFTEALIETLHESSVRNFNNFRDYLDSVMSRQKTPGAQDPYFEGPLGADLPFWPKWEDASGLEETDSEESSSDSPAPSEELSGGDDIKTQTCPQCSHEFDENMIVCPFCGWKSQARLLLTGVAGKRFFWGRFSVGRSLLQSICGEDDARFADSSEQFVLELNKDKRWSVSPGRGKNPTFLNGKRLSKQTVLQTNDILSIGLRRARMTVSID